MTTRPEDFLLQAWKRQADSGLRLLEAMVVEPVGIAHLHEAFRRMAHEQELTVAEAELEGAEERRGDAEGDPEGDAQLEEQRQRDHHQHDGEDQGHQVPAALGLRVHVQEIDHVHDDLDHGQRDDDQRGGEIRKHAVHHQIERDDGQHHRQEEADDVALARAVRGMVVECVGAHRRIPIR